MRKAIFKIMVVLIVLLQSILLYGCMRIEKVEKQTEYHERVSELEEYVLNEMGDYISFGELDIDEEREKIIWSIDFVSEYYDDQSQKQEYSPLEVMEDTRRLINSFLLDNPDYFVNDYEVLIRVFAVSGGYIEYGEWRNIMYDTHSYLEGYLCYVDYYSLLDSRTVDTIDCSGIKEAGVSYCLDVEEVLYIIDQMPDLEIVWVYQDLETEISEQRPDLVVNGRNERITVPE
ncbi:MAG: hypothetical protein IJ869_07680 [Clostridiales bacterium]|nr:hypothetical protein [Clostridiales bacterium]